MRPWSQSRVLVVGVGGLGCPASLALASSGVGALTLADGDRVDLSNLHRQLWYGDGDVGRPKARAAARQLRRLFPTPVEVLEARVDSDNVERLFADHDWVLDGVDSVETKLLLSDAAVRSGTPLVYGGVVRLQGQAMVIRPGGPCLRCLFEDGPASGGAPTCSSAGVLGSLAGAIGGLQVALALQASSGVAQQGCATLVRVDGARLECRATRVFRNPECVSCAGMAGPHAAEGAA